MFILNLADFYGNNVTQNFLWHSIPFFVRILPACENKRSTEAVVAEADKIVLTMGAKIVFNELFSNTFPFLFS